MSIEIRDLEKVYRLGIEKGRAIEVRALDGVSLRIEPNEYVDRIRRIQLNDLENLPYFLFAGLLYVLTGPPLWLAQVLLYGYVVSRLAHFAAYFTASTHDTRATFWTVGSLILIFMTCRTLAAALGY